MDGPSQFRAFLRSRWGIGAIAFLGIAALLLVFDHWSHIVESNVLLGILLLACVGMHLFMHAGHGRHGNHNPDGE